MQHISLTPDEVLNSSIYETQTSTVRELCHPSTFEVFLYYTAIARNAARPRALYFTTSADCWSPYIYKVDSPYYSGERLVVSNI